MEQGNYKASAKSISHIISDYQSPADAFFNPVLNFKYSINGKDNEMPMGENHLLLLQAKGGQPIIVRTVFGDRANPKIPNEGLEKVQENTVVRFELDMHPVLDAFEKDGFYIEQVNKLKNPEFTSINKLNSYGVCKLLMDV